MDPSQFANEQRALQSDAPIVGVSWDTYLAYMDENWHPGRHLALIGPTGEGKTTLAVGLLNLRKWVVALDPKGEDDTLSASGFIRVDRLPLPRRIRNAVAEGKPARIIIGGTSRNEREQAQLRELMREAIEMVRGQGGWTLFADEFQILSDIRMFNLGKQIEQLLISARKNGTSVVTAYQAPAWVSHAATRQAWGTAIWPTRDRAMIQAVAQGMGRDWRQLAAAIDALEQYFAIFIPKSIHAPMILVHPPKVS